MLKILAPILLSILVALSAIEATRLHLEKDFQDELAAEVKHRAFELTTQTMQGSVMGSVANLGLLNLTLKHPEKGALQDSASILQAAGQMYQANSVYIMNAEGTVQSSWYTTGIDPTGINLRFRPYFQIAMQGKQNVYAALSSTVGKPLLYIAAPLYSGISPSTPVIGAVVARMNTELIDTVLKTWHGPALLLTPQQLTFASSRPDWVSRMAGQATPAQLLAIHELKQFGNAFAKEAPIALPFDLNLKVVNIEHQRYALARASIQWNDPQGEWTLVWLGELDSLMPASRRALIGLLSVFLTLTFYLLFLRWHGRLQKAIEERLCAEAELKVYARQLESDSTFKSYLVAVSCDLQQAVSLADFSTKLMAHTIAHLKADYGAFYILDKSSQRLIPIGGYGALAGELDAVELGQGLLGQCAKDQTPIVLTDSAEAPVQIVWGAGQVRAGSTILLPVVQAGQLLGVFVLAALLEIDAQKQTQLAAMLPMVAMNLEILNRNIGLQRMVWGSQYMVEFKQIDLEHEELVGMICLLADAINEKRSNLILEKLLEDLILYTTKHFAMEENLMLTHAYPGYSAHLKEHLALKKTVNDLKNKFKAGKSTATIETVHLLSNWLSHHILKVDKHLAAFLNAAGIT